MLGQLLHSLSSPSSRRQSSRHPPLDSATEDLHTQELLFPASSLLRDHDGQIHAYSGAEGGTRWSRASATYSHLPGHEALDLESPRDIRILIAQAGHGGLQPELLFDSKPTPASESPKVPTGRHSRNSSRTENIAGSLSSGGRLRGNVGVPSIPEDSYHRRSGSAFSTSGAIERARLRRSSVSSAHSFVDPFQEPGKERDEIEKIALGCMFENAPSSYKGMSNKVHIVPLASRPYESAYLSQSLGSDPPLSARPQLTRKPSSLSKSHVPGDAPVPLDSDISFREQQGSTQSQSNRRTVLVTRTFSITWFDDDISDDPKTFITSQPRASSHNRTHGNVQHERRPSRSRTHRSPLYAVTIVLQLPIAPHDASPPLSRTNTFGRKTLRKDSSSHYSHVSLGSSFESDRRAHWLQDPFFGQDALASMAVSSDVDDRVDLIGQHWDIISRTLTTVQTLAQNKILELLRPLCKIPRSLRLPAQALYADIEVKKGAEECSVRIVRGMKIPRVRTGIGKWPIWREEARWLANWAGGREENLFFFILITGFLGTHTEWLHSLAPKWYRRKFREQQRLLNQAHKMSVPSRTVIISADKMAARRLIFLLAAFLPANHQTRGDSSPLRPSTAASFRAYSQSPPSQFPMSRQQSLRRTINRRGKSGVSRTRQPESRASSVTAVSSSHDDRTETGTIRPSGSEDHVRQSTEARSIRAKLASSDVDPSQRKSQATSSSIMPDAVVIKPHFSRQASFGPGTKPSHSRTSSAASMTLLAPLQQVSSNESQGSKPWSYSIRNLWGGRRSSTSEYSDFLQTTDEGLGIVGIRPLGSSSKLQQMVDEVYHDSPKETEGRKSAEGHMVMFASPELGEMSIEQQATADGSRPIEIPLRMSMNKDDGVIDVEIPFGDFGSPTVLSPGPGGDNSGSSYGGSSFGGQQSILTLSPKEPEHPINVGGWLDKLHPDFMLQAVKPYGDVLKDVKAAMSAEPTPPLSEPLPESSSSVEKWLNICTTLVADTGSYSIKRLRLRRLVRYVSGSTGQAPHTPGFVGFPIRSQYGNPYREPALVGPSGTAAAITEFTLDEEFEEEVIRDIDRDFVEVVERVTGVSGSPTKTQSTASSRASSVRGRPTGTDETGSSEAIGDNARDCKKLIVGCLEAIILAEAQGRSRAKKGGSNDPKDRVGADTESTLRDGVRKWLEDVESKNAADGSKSETTPKGNSELLEPSGAVPIPITPSSSEKGKENGARTSSVDPGRTPTPSQP